MTTIGVVRRQTVNCYIRTCFAILSLFLYSYRSLVLLLICSLFNGGTQWRSLSRHCCATSQEGVGSIPDEIIGIFH